MLLTMKKLLPFLWVCLGSLAACRKEKSEESLAMAYLSIRFHPQINGSDLKLNSNYTNIYGENFSLTAVKFYTGLYQLGNRSEGTSVESSGGPYWLSDLSKPSSMAVSASIPPGIYNQLKFLVGVDSTRNVSGVQSGDLDPAAGMFWTWNSGYIYIKIEGNSPASPEPNGKFEYHIGGFRYPDSAIRTFTADLTDPDLWELSAGDSLHMDINIALDQFFSSPIPLKIAETPVCTTPGQLAAGIADNFAAAIQVSNFDIR